MAVSIRYERNIGLRRGDFQPYTSSHGHTPTQSTAKNPPWSRVNDGSRIMMPAIVQASEDAPNSTQPQPEIGRLSARMKPPISPVMVPNHLRKVSMRVTLRRIG